MVQQQGNGTISKKRSKPASERFLGKHPLLRKIFMRKEIYLMILFPLVHLIIFAYVPMYGISLAFKDYLPKYGIIGSPNVGFEHFETLLSSPMFGRAIRNTLTISGLNLIISFPIPIILSLMLNEFQHARYKKWIQTAIYLPNFISWVIIGELARQLFQTDGGIVNNIIVAMGGQPISFLTSTEWFYPLLLILSNWKGAGYGTILYLACLAGVDPNLYEAARIDGASRFRQVWSISIPSMLSIVVLQFLMSIGNIMNAGFDPIFNLYNIATYPVADIIDTYVYRLGLQEMQFEMSTALGLFKTVVNFVLIIGANVLAKKLCGYNIYVFDD